jgi:hypothetical protein
MVLLVQGVETDENGRAPPKLTPCFLRFCAAFCVFHENTFLYTH